MGPQAQCLLWRTRQKPGELAVPITCRVLQATAPSPGSPAPSHSEALPWPLGHPSCCPPNHLVPQNNKLEKIPPGAFSELSHLRELYLQNNYLTDEGLDNETFW